MALVMEYRSPSRLWCLGGATETLENVFLIYLVTESMDDTIKDVICTYLKVKTITRKAFLELLIQRKHKGIKDLTIKALMVTKLRRKLRCKDSCSSTSLNNVYIHDTYLLTQIRDKTCV